MQFNFKKIQWLLKAAFISVTDLAWLASLIMAASALFTVGTDWLNPFFTALETWAANPGWFGITPNLLFPTLQNPQLFSNVHQGLNLTGVMLIGAFISSIFVSIRTFILSKDIPYTLASWNNARRLKKLQQKIEAAANLAELIDINEVGRSDRLTIQFEIQLDLQRISSKIQEN